MRLRVATGADAMAVATLHAESSRAHYRGAYRDEYLDGDVVQDRIRVWKERLSTPVPNQFVVLAAEDDDLIGFACAYGGHDETWASLLLRCSRSVALRSLSAFIAVKPLWRPREARAPRVVRRLGEVCRGCNLPPTLLGPRGVDQKFAIVAKFPE